MESAIHTRLICFILVVIKDYESAFDGVTTKAKGPFLRIIYMTSAPQDNNEGILSLPFIFRCPFFR